MELPLPCVALSCVCYWYSTQLSINALLPANGSLLALSSHHCAAASESSLCCLVINGQFRTCSLGHCNRCTASLGNPPLLPRNASLTLLSVSASIMSKRTSADKWSSVLWWVHKSQETAHNFLINSNIHHLLDFQVWHFSRNCPVLASITSITLLLVMCSSPRNTAE